MDDPANRAMRLADRTGKPHLYRDLVDWRASSRYGWGCMAPLDQVLDPGPLVDAARAWAACRSLREWGMLHSDGGA